MFRLSTIIKLFFGPKVPPLTLLQIIFNIIHILHYFALNTKNLSLTKSKENLRNHLFNKSKLRHGTLVKRENEGVLLQLYLFHNALVFIQCWLSIMPFISG